MRSARMYPGGGVCHDGDPKRMICVTDRGQSHTYIRHSIDIFRFLSYRFYQLLPNNARLSIYRIACVCIILYTYTVASFSIDVYIRHVHIFVSATNI